MDNSLVKALLEIGGTNYPIDDIKVVSEGTEKDIVRNSAGVSIFYDGELPAISFRSERRLKVGAEGVLVYLSPDRGAMIVTVDSIERTTGGYICSAKVDSFTRH